MWKSTETIFEQRISCAKETKQPSNVLKVIVCRSFEQNEKNRQIYFCNRLDVQIKDCLQMPKKWDKAQKKNNHFFLFAMSCITAIQPTYNGYFYVNCLAHYYVGFFFLYRFFFFPALYKSCFIFAFQTKQLFIKNYENQLADIVGAGCC